MTASNDTAQTRDDAKLVREARAFLADQPDKQGHNQRRRFVNEHGDHDMALTMNAHCATADDLIVRLADRLAATAEKADALEAELVEWRTSIATEKLKWRIAELEAALRLFAEKWDLHAADYLVGEFEEEMRALPVRVIDEMIEDVKAARAALADTEQETA